MVPLKLERLEVPVEVCGGLLIESIVERVKINRLTRVPMNQKQSRSMNESWDVLKALAVCADAIIVKKEEEDTLSVEDRGEHCNQLTYFHVSTDHHREWCIVGLIVDRDLEDEG